MANSNLYPLPGRFKDITSSSLKYFKTIPRLKRLLLFTEQYKSSYLNLLDYQRYIENFAVTFYWN